ncbi:hypothetical protein EMIT0P218_11064 [Pseudomonas sp. IT-P218]
MISDTQLNPCWLPQLISDTQLNPCWLPQLISDTQVNPCGSQPAGDGDNSVLDQTQIASHNG